jgi:GNAT superfamily N-acetyltransferase
MRLERIIDPGSAAFQQIWKIYESSFPIDERRTLDQQKHLFANSLYSLLAAYASDTSPTGFISSWKVADFHFIEHMAIREIERKKGAGTRMLHAFMSGKRKIILEAENPESGEQKLRIRFYQNAGFRLNNYDYLQPPYGLDKKPVHLLLLSHPDKLDALEFYNVRNLLHRTVYGLHEPLV